MPVNKVIRLILVDQPAKASKSSMAEIFGIVYESRRCMRNNDIDPALPPDHRSQPPNDRTHLAFSVLVWPPVIPAGSFQPQKVESFDPLQPGVQIDTTLRPFVFVSDIVVSADKIKWCTKYVNQPGKILRRQITARNDHINIGKGFLPHLLMQHRIHDVRNG